MNKRLPLLVACTILFLSIPSHGERKGDPEYQNKQAEQEAEQKRRQAEEQRIREAQTVEAARQEALKIIAEGSKVRQDLQELQRRETELNRRLETFNRNDFLMKAGIFGVISTGFVGIMAIFMNYRGGNAGRRLDQLTIIEKEHELRTKGLLK
jgi:hypothetical protein